jgi:formate hydrogenlyase transcriptional activator
MTSCHFHTVQRNNADKMARDFNLENCMTKVGPIETKSIVSLDQRVAFESMIADLSARFANVPTDLVESEIKQAQVTLRKFLGFDRSSFAEFMEDGSLDVLSTTAIQGVDQVSLGKYRPEFDWYHRQLLAGEAVVWRASDTLPVEAAAELNYVRRVKL